MALFLSFLFFSFLFFSYPFSDTWSEWKKKMKQILMLEVRRTGFRLVSSDAFLHSWHEVPAEPRGDKISRWLWSPIKTGWRFTLIFERHQKKKKKDQEPPQTGNLSTFWEITLILMITINHFRPPPYGNSSKFSNVMTNFLFTRLGYTTGSKFRLQFKWNISPKILSDGFYWQGRY